MQSGKNFEYISEKIAELKVQISQYGKFGLLNINNYCEGFVMRLLNDTYGYKMRNLNYPNINFPGLDIGSEHDGIAFQVTSEKSSIKINETLETVLKFRHHNTFATIKIFVLSGKQGKYSISVDTSNYFTFDANADIIDFDDLLKEIKNCPAEQIKEISTFIQMEFPNTLDAIKSSIKSSVEPSTLVDYKASLEKCRLSRYTHWILKLRFHGGTFSTQDIYRQMSRQFKDFQTKRFLELFNPAYQKGTTAAHIQFHKELVMDGATNIFKEAILEIKNNSIIYERVEYNLNQLMITHLDHEIYALISLLLLCKAVFKNKDIQLEVHMELNTNADLHFNQQHSCYRTVDQPLASYVLNPQKLSFAKMIHNIDNEIIMKIMQELIDGFVAKSDFYSIVQPFMEIDEKEQSKVIDSIRQIFFPSEF